MKNQGRQFVPVMVVLLLISCWTAAHAQITPRGDAYINTAEPTTNFGTAITLGVVSPSQTTFIAFDLSSLPAGDTGASIAKATLKLYVSSVATAGSFNVDLVNGSWTEATLTANNAPALGTTIAASVPLSKSQTRDYVLIDITHALQDWLNGTPNDGIALVANSPLSATFESKENTKESHNAELDVVFVPGIAGVNTAPGSGLTGGGTSGTLNLSLTTSCATNQVLEWNGSAWVCSAAGTGTITGVTAGTDLTGGGTSGNVTLNLDTTKVPQLATANTFTSNQTVNGNLSATGLVSGSAFNIGSNLFASGNYGNGNAFLGFGGNTATTGLSVTAAGYQALFSDTAGDENSAFGTWALHYTIGSGNTAVGAYAFSNPGSGDGNTAIGDNSGACCGFTGSYNTFLGFATSGPSNGSLNYATAVGAQSEVDQSSSIVLGRIAGVNASPADTYVGIGTTKPQTFFHVNHAPPSGGQDLVEITSGGGSDVGSLIIQNTSASGLRLRVGAGTGVAYLASSGALNLVTADTGTPSNPNPSCLGHRHHWQREHQGEPK